MSAEIGTNGVWSGRDTVVIHLQFSASKSDELRKFTREHINQETQLLVGTKVVAEPHITAEISGGKVDLVFSSVDQAQAVADLLNERWTMWPNQSTEPAALGALRSAVAGVNLVRRWLSFGR